MEIDPVIVLKRKSDLLKLSYDLCIICQVSSKGQLRSASEGGKKKVRECIQRRRKFKDAASIEMFDRLESLNENEWGSAEINGIRHVIAH